MPSVHPIEQLKETDSLSDEIEDELNQLYKEQVLGHFSDILFTNSGCWCQGNNGCTRGCKLESHLNGSQSPPIRKCRGRKSISRSSDECARHVIGAMMTVLHEFLLGHCENTGDRILKNKVDYDQCVDNFNQDLRNHNISICRHGFRFKYAYCMLNLDGQSAHLYKNIPNRAIRSECKRWDQYNQFLLAVNTSLYPGDIALIPLFRKISPKRNKEFQKDPGKIPKGAIIITKLSSEYGHVEVKTDRDECGADKNQTCFCSDFCEERLRYDSPVRAVFEWNPEFIRYAKTNNYYLDFLSSL